MTNYDVVFKSRESYYRILKAGQLSWQKANVENSRKQPDIIKKKDRIAELLCLYKPEIEAGELVVYALDECHLQGDDICNYLWGNSQESMVVKLDNQGDRQTYYGALNLVNQEFIVKPYKAGNGENTVKFVEELKRMNPQQNLVNLGWC